MPYPCLPTPFPILRFEGTQDKGKIRTTSPGFFSDHILLQNSGKSEKCCIKCRHQFGQMPFMYVMTLKRTVCNGRVAYLKLLGLCLLQSQRQQCMLGRSTHGPMPACHGYTFRVEDASLKGLRNSGVLRKGPPFHGSRS